MSLAIFELIDSSLGYGSTPADWSECPGFAQIKNDSIITGTEAFDCARIDPQNSFNQYWLNLNQAPLSNPSKLVRHNADLAYAQLQQLYQNSNRPAEVLFAVPATITNEQLSLLLGLAQALPFNAVGLVDSAVATVSQQTVTENTLFVDLQLHQLVCTQLSVGDNVNRDCVEVFNDVGLKHLMDSSAHFIADQFIKQFRFDPFHTAQSEQQLYNKLSGWVTQLHNNPQTLAQLSTEKGNFQLSLQRDELIAHSYTRLQSAITSIEQLTDRYPNIIISHRLAQLPGLESIFKTSFSSSSNLDTLQGCLTNLELLRCETNSLSFITRLPIPRNRDLEERVSTAPTAVGHNTNTELPSHVLIDDHAIPLESKLTLIQTDSGVKSCPAADLNAEVDTALVIEKSAHGFIWRIHNSSSPGDNTNLAELGSVIDFAGECIRLIRVIDQ
jgi:hypothetical protein